MSLFEPLAPGRVKGDDLRPPPDHPEEEPGGEEPLALPTKMDTCVMGGHSPVKKMSA